MYQTEQLDRNEQIALDQITENMRDVDAAMSLNLLSSLLRKIWRKKVLIFLDEYDTPLQEAYVNGYWDELTAFIRTLFNNAFKTNPSLERGVMAGITCLSKKSVFADMNHLVTVTATSEQYAAAFGFTEQEVFTALERQGFTENDKQNVKSWYDGFTFGRVTDIYNPTKLFYSPESTEGIGYMEIDGVAVQPIDSYEFNTLGTHKVDVLLKDSSTMHPLHFEDVSTLREIVIPSSMDSLSVSRSNGLFYRCRGIERITCLSSIPPSVTTYTSDGTNRCDFAYMNENGTVYVPYGTKQQYTTAWAGQSAANCITLKSVHWAIEELPQSED